jgi:hypothetical protein
VATSSIRIPDSSPPRTVRVNRTLGTTARTSWAKASRSRPRQVGLDQVRAGGGDGVDLVVPEGHQCADRYRTHLDQPVERLDRLGGVAQLQFVFVLLSYVMGSSARGILSPPHSLRSSPHVRRIIAN